MTLFDPDGVAGAGSRRAVPDAPAAPAGPLVRVRLLVAYDGRGFRGFAANPGVRTVAGVLAAALERVVGHRVELTCAGRTDAGVHAWGQVVSLDVAGGRADPVALQRAVNRMCGPELVVREAALAPADFDARRSAVGRRYRYTVLNRPVPDPFLAGFSWHVPEPLDLRSMRAAGDPFVGEHDFSSFCRRPKGAPEASLVRRVTEVAVGDDGDGVLRVWVAANAFCHQMVRSMVATIVAAGRGRVRAGEVRAILAARDRRAAAGVAPPEGLCLWEVAYP